MNFFRAFFSFIKGKTNKQVCDEGGAAAVEFALVFPVFIMLIMMIFEFSFIMYLRSVVEASANSVARRASTGVFADPNQINVALETAIGNVAFSAEDIVITSELYDRIEAVSGVDGTISTDFARSNALVKYTISFNYRYITPVLAFLPNDTMTALFPIISSVFIKHEEY